MWSTLLLFVFCINGAKSFCFREETSTAVREVQSTIPVEDWFHCKLECAARYSDCHAFINTGKSCDLFYKETDGNAASRQVWVKKTEGCPDTAEPAITANYENLTPGRFAQLKRLDMPHPFTPFSTDSPCRGGAILDVVTRSGKMNKIYGNGKIWISWDKQLEAWALVEQNRERNPDEKPYYNEKTYIRGAQCYEIDPEQFSDTKDCFGGLPTHDKVSEGYVSIGAVEQYGVFKYCPNKNADSSPPMLQFFTDTNKVEPETRVASETRVICVDGFFFLADYKDDLYTVSSLQKIEKGTCVEKANA